jgi:hypothetical protein
MSPQREIDKRIDKKKQEIAELEKRLGESKAYLSALQDTAKLFPKEDGVADKVPVLRPGTDLAKSRDLLKSVGKPLHITEILKGIGKDVNKGNRISLSGSLGGYARKGIIFSKPAPNTFGLIELENESHDLSDTLTHLLNQPLETLLAHKK